MAARKKLPDFQVLIPYTELAALLEASEKLDSLLAENKRLEDQQEALRGQFAELMIAFGDLRKFVTD